MIGYRMPRHSKKCKHRVCESGHFKHIKETLALRSGVMDLKLRSGRPEDADACGRICGGCEQRGPKALIMATEGLGGPGILVPTTTPTCSAGA